MLNVLHLSIGVFSIIFLFEAVVALHASYSYGMCEVSVDPFLCFVLYILTLCCSLSFLPVTHLRIAVLCVIHVLCLLLSRVIRTIPSQS